jgi:DNA-directed RNA polymerase subunit K/omega|uniref:DNA-directed RNA polymerase n=1 Tax=viral metagenome TaxID=1070528 RepID=A0A6C0LFN9_9ZZZZ
MAITYKANVVEDVLKVMEHLNDTKISKPIMTIYEFDKIIALRTQQIASGAPLFVNDMTTDVKSNMELRQIALKELTEGRLPFMVERKLPNNKKEYYRVRDLDLVAVRDRIR